MLNSGQPGVTVARKHGDRVLKEERNHYSKIELEAAGMCLHDSGEPARGGHGPVHIGNPGQNQEDGRMPRKTRVEQLTEKKEAIIEGCTYCGICLEECHIRPFSTYASEDPVELNRARIAFLEGGPFSQVVYDMAYGCMGCMYCSDLCPEGLDASSIPAISKIELAKRGHFAPPQTAAILPHLPINYFKVFQALLLHPSQTRWLTEVPEQPEHADVVFYLGCGAHIAPDLLLTALDILDRMNIDYVALGGVSFCCGNVYVAEWADEGTKQFNGLIDALSAFTPKTVLTFCAGCGTSIGRANLDAADAPFEHMHLSTFIGENADRLDFDGPIEKTVTIHDPCSLGRGMGEVDGVRKTLTSIPGLRVVEMEHRGRGTRCCGSGSNDPKAGASVGRCRMEEATKTDADILIDNCIGCHRMFRSLAADYAIEPTHFLAFVGKALGIEHENTLSKYMGWGDLDRIMEDAGPNIEASGLPKDAVRAFLGQILAAS